MEIKKEEKVTISLLGEDAKNFTNAIAKIATGDTKIGFSKTALSEKEQDVIKQINNKL